jgi:hypothetical protein
MDWVYKKVLAESNTQEGNSSHLSLFLILGDRTLFRSGFQGGDCPTFRDADFPTSGDRGKPIAEDSGF